MDAKIKSMVGIKTSSKPVTNIESQLTAYLSWKVWNPKTGVVLEQNGKKAESFLRGFMDILLTMFDPVIATIGTPIKDYNGNDVFVDHCGETFNCMGAIGITYHGIAVGTGTTSPTISDYSMETLIQHDSAPPTAGRMQYGVVTLGAPTSDATKSQYTITRNFSNASGGSITVNEIGMLAKMVRFGGASATYSQYYILVLRDVISGGVAVPNGQTLTVNYQPTATV